MGAKAPKREIVAACEAPSVSVLMVAQQYDVNTNLVFTWRNFRGARQYPKGLIREWLLGRVYNTLTYLVHFVAGARFELTTFRYESDRVHDQAIDK